MLLLDFVGVFSKTIKNTHHFSRKEIWPETRTAFSLATVLSWHQHLNLSLDGSGRPVRSVRSSEVHKSPHRLWPQQWEKLNSLWNPEFNFGILVVWTFSQKNKWLRMAQCSPSLVPQKKEYDRSQSPRIPAAPACLARASPPWWLAERHPRSGTWGRWPDEIRTGRWKRHWAQSWIRPRTHPLTQLIKTIGSVFFHCHLWNFGNWSFVWQFGSQLQPLLRQQQKEAGLARDLKSD